MSLTRWPSHAQHGVSISAGLFFVQGIDLLAGVHHRSRLGMDAAGSGGRGKSGSSLDRLQRLRPRSLRAPSRDGGERCLWRFVYRQARAVSADD